jgi:DNA-binding response OmpR family regulator
MPQKILIVDDTEPILRLYNRAFETAGYEVITALDGSTAVESAQNELPNLIILDLMLPDITGIDVLNQLKQNEATSNLPVIMLSAVDDPTIFKQALEAGAARFLVKSNVEPDQIISIAQEVLAAHQPENIA